MKLLRTVKTKNVKIEAPRVVRARCCKQHARVHCCKSHSSR